MKEVHGTTNLRMTTATGEEMLEEEPGTIIRSQLMEMLGVKRKTLSNLERPGVIRRHLSRQMHGEISQHKPAKEEAVGELNNLHITLYLSSL